MPCWKRQCSSPKEQKETSGAVNDSCLHSTFHLETAKAPLTYVDKTRFTYWQNVAAFAAKCSEYFQKECNMANCCRAGLEGSQPVL